jgi:D-alanyl-lipoteichoic acid acyltransferase DltB (MBOAT superfamily)
MQLLDIFTHGLNLAFIAVGTFLCAAIARYVYSHREEIVAYRNEWLEDKVRYVVWIALMAVALAWVLSRVVENWHEYLWTIPIGIVGFLLALTLWQEWLPLTRVANKYFPKWAKKNKPIDASSI